MLKGRREIQGRKAMKKGPILSSSWHVLAAAAETG